MPKRTTLMPMQVKHTPLTPYTKRAAAVKSGTAVLEKMRKNREVSHRHVLESTETVAKRYYEALSRRGLDPKDTKNKFTLPDKSTINYDDVFA